MTQDAPSAQHTGKLQKIPVDAGFTCPNRDGTVGWGGCIYCDNTAFTPPYCDSSKTVAEQLQAGKRFFANKYPNVRYLAYFQSYTGSHAPFDQLQRCYEQALGDQEVDGLVIATRPDCINDQCLDYLQRINEQKIVIVELGIETMHDHTLALVNRCHNWATSCNAVRLIAKRGIEVCAHLILGLPGESDDDMRATATAVSQLPVSRIKFHQLQVVRGTKLEHLVKCGQLSVRNWTAQQYAQLCSDIAACLRPDIIVERWVAQAPQQMIVTPRWGLKPSEFQQMLKGIHERI